MPPLQSLAHCAGMMRNGRIDYRMAKRALVRQVTRGAVAVQDVIDAHPELMRAARNIGTETARTCPICRLADDRADVPIDRENTLREVTYVYGDALRQRTGRVVWDDAELEALAAQYPSFTAYRVECCLVCGWNHLVTSELFGTDHVPGRRLGARLNGAEG
ncbi:DUF5318 domain-containing protein [soil metagenome]